MHHSPYSFDGYPVICEIPTPVAREKKALDGPDKKETFSSRWGMLLSILGIAVGTGNIWRFPRIAAKTGGEEGAGSFLIAWVVFLLFWSIPLIIAEFAIGRKSRLGVAGSFARLLSGRLTWMGAFVGMVATAIMFYYSVVNGWCLYYFTSMTVKGLPADSAASQAVWDQFQAGRFPLLCHFLVMVLGALVVIRGIRAIEKVNRVLVPTLLLIILVSACRALTLPGAFDGVRYLFTPDIAQLKNPNVWLEALTQNAWDTGAGWGLILTYAVYMQRKQGVTLNACLTGFGNNSVSLIAALTIFSTVFATLGSSMSQGEIIEVMKTSGPASTGLTFIWMPQLFSRMPFGHVFAIFFFLALSFAAFSSLISMVELASRSLVDMGLRRWKAVLLVCGVGYLFGVPSALDLDFFGNQDFVWGVGLMISGAFIAFLCIRCGAERFRREVINLETRDITLGRWWDHVIRFVIPVECVVLLAWWMFLSASVYAPESWYDPFSTYSVATCVFQWGMIMVVLLALNRFMSKRLLGPGRGC